jgi:hypothetical protein
MDAQVAARAQDITAAYLVAFFQQNSGWQGNMQFSVEDGLVVIKSPTTGNSSFVSIQTGGSALAFVGDNTDMSNEDEIGGYDEAHAGVGYMTWNSQYLGDLDTMNTEVQAMPDDVAKPILPLITLAKNLLSVVPKLLSVLQGVVKIGGLSLPDPPKAAIGLIAQKGISLGTPDRIVGVGGQGIVFVADGGTGLADHAKYVPVLEDAFNRIAGADPLKEYEAPPATPDSLGFRVYSDTTVDLVARNTAHLLALGRGTYNNEVVGVGVARVAGSYAVEVAGREHIVLRTPKSTGGDSRIAMVSEGIAIGRYDKAGDDAPFMLTDRGTTGQGTTGFKDATKTALPQTSTVQVHAADLACIAVGEYMVQVRSKSSNEALKKTIQDEIDDATTRQQTAQTDEPVATKKYTDLVAEREKMSKDKKVKPAALAKKEMEAHVAKRESDRLKAALKKATDDLKIAQAKLADVYEDDGVTISLRDDAKKAPNYSAKKDEPSFSMSKEKGLQLQTLTDNTDKDDSTNVKLLLNKDGLTIKVGKKAGIVVKNDSIQMTDGTSKVELKKDSFIKLDSQDVKLSAAKKIALG